jgi:stage V sporulation protein G
MKITRVVVTPIAKKGSRLCGYASIVFDDVFQVKNIRLINGKEGIFIVFPNKETLRPCPKCKVMTSYRHKFCYNCGDELAVIIPAATYKDVCYPVTQEFHNVIAGAILAEYENLSTSKGASAIGK